MALDERARHELFSRVEEVLGPVPAETLFGYLPPVGWADVATKHDLLQLEERLNARIGAVEERFDALEERLDARMDALEERQDARMEALEERHAARMEALEHRLIARMDERFAGQARAMAQQTWAILVAVLVALVGAVVTTAVL
ncbi:MAG TPA: hypothetical protein VM287_07740 [Egibacteraceae bacterium]|nr:hypothetical protein [Egibacteraceae bacterium]